MNPIQLSLTVFCLAAVCPAVGAAVGFEYPPAEGKGAVVVPQQAAKLERLAAETVAYYLGKTTGSRPAIVEETESIPLAGSVFVGATRRGKDVLGELDDLPGDGYAMRTSGGGVFLAGPLPAGTLNAVVGFVQDELGVVWGAPDPRWHHVPRKERISLPEINRREKPAFAYRVVSGLNDPRPAGEPPISYFQAMRLSDPSYRPRHGFGHNLHNVISEEQYGASHPEYFAEIDGRRMVGTAEQPLLAQPCCTNADVVRITVEAVRAAFDADPARQTFSLCTNDNVLYCRCASCAALDSPAREWRGCPDYSGSYFDYVRRVAEEVRKTHPDRYITAYAYWGAILTPRHIKKFPDNVHVALTQDVSQHFDPAYREADLKMVQAWREKVRTLSVYVYWNLGWVTPRTFPHLAADYLRAVTAKGAHGMYCEAYPNWTFQGPMIYTSFRQMWDPALDTDELLERYMNAMFGDQAQTMSEFYRVVGQYWAQPRPGEWFQGLDRIAGEMNIANPELLGQAIGLLYRARLGTTDETVGARLDAMIRYVRLPELVVENHLAARRWREAERGPDPLVDAGARDEARRMAQRDREAAWIADAFLGKDPNYPDSYYRGSRFWQKIRSMSQETQGAIVAALIRSVQNETGCTGALPRWEETREWAEELRLGMDLAQQMRPIFGTFGAIEAADFVSRVDRLAPRGIAVDGDLGDWPAEAFQELAYVPLGDYATDRIAARAAVSWDEGSLYLAAVVEDATHVQTRSDAGIWMEDSIQIGIDPLRDAFERGAGRYDPDDVEVGFALAGERVVAWRYTGEAPGPFPEAEVVIRHESGVTTYEAALPWAAIAPGGVCPRGFVGVNVAVNASNGGPRSACAWTDGLVERKEPRAFRSVWLVRPEEKP